jgi:hypothetical protein
MLLSTLISHKNWVIKIRLNYPNGVFPNTKKCWLWLKNESKYRYAIWVIKNTNNGGCYFDSVFNLVDSQAKNRPFICRYIMVIKNKVKNGNYTDGHIKRLYTSPRMRFTGRFSSDRYQTMSFPCLLNKRLILSGNLIKNCRGKGGGYIIPGAIWVKI